MSCWNAQVVIALAFILLGVLLLLRNLGLIVWNWGIVWALVLIGLGIRLVWRAFQPVPTGVSCGMGNYRPRLVGKEMRNANFSHGVGDFELDFTGATIPAGTSRVYATLGLGNLTVIVPRDLAVRVRARAVLGDVQVFQYKGDGIAPHVEFASEDYATATRKLDLQASVGIGDAKVIRAE